MLTMIALIFLLLLIVSLLLSLELLSSSTFIVLIFEAVLFSLTTVRLTS